MEASAERNGFSSFGEGWVARKERVDRDETNRIGLRGQPFFGTPVGTMKFNTMDEHQPNGMDENSCPKEQVVLTLWIQRGDTR